MGCTQHRTSLQVVCMVKVVAAEHVLSNKGIDPVWFMIRFQADRGIRFLAVVIRFHPLII